LFLSIFQSNTLSELILFQFMWQIFVFIEKTYFIASKYSFYPEFVTEQIFLYGVKKIIVKESWSQFFMGRVFHGAKSRDWQSWGRVCKPLSRVKLLDPFLPHCNIPCYMPRPLPPPQFKTYFFHCPLLKANLWKFAY
jgi:hypothetical protein